MNNWNKFEEGNYPYINQKIMVWDYEDSNRIFYSDANTSPLYRNLNKGSLWQPIDINDKKSLFKSCDVCGSNLTIQDLL